ncbi:MAG: hypothetical protein DCC75_12050, partial [Proteobacteria bacterium]
MSINRLTRERLFTDERLFNDLLPYAKYDDEYQIFLLTDDDLSAILQSAYQRRNQSGRPPAA